MKLPNGNHVGFVPQATSTEDSPGLVHLVVSSSTTWNTFLPYVDGGTNSTWSLADEYFHLQNTKMRVTRTSPSIDCTTALVRVTLMEVKIFDKINRREGHPETCRQHRVNDSLE